MSEIGHGQAMVRRDEGHLANPGDFGPEHMRIVRDAFAPTATAAEFEVLWAGAKARGLDPVRKQIHFVKRFDNARNCDVWSSQVSIDGFRSIAENTGRYDGQDEPEFEYDREERLILARVRVYRKDIGRPFVGVARWSEYVQTKKNGDPTYMWAKMEHTMLGKCAEALALRKAFPEPLAGLYTSDEMEQASSEAAVAPQWQRVDHPMPPLPAKRAPVPASRALPQVIAEAAAGVPLDQPTIDLKVSELRALMATRELPEIVQRNALDDFARRVRAREEVAKADAERLAAIDRGAS